MAKQNNRNLFKRGDTWYFRKKVRKRWRKMALSQSATEARRLRDQYLKEILLYGDIQKFHSDEGDDLLFCENAERWARITERRVKSSTYRGYKIAMGAFILKEFGKTPIGEISYLDVEESAVLLLPDLCCRVGPRQSLEFMMKA